HSALPPSSVPHVACAACSRATAGSPRHAAARVTAAHAEHVARQTAGNEGGSRRVEGVAGAPLPALVRPPTIGGTCRRARACVVRGNTQRDECHSARDGCGYGAVLCHGSAERGIEDELMEEARTPNIDRPGRRQATRAELAR